MIKKLHTQLGVLEKRVCSMICEFCGEDVKHTVSTTFYSFYCLECLKTVLYETREAIKELKSKGD